jgi:hypothetical protein
VGRNDDLNNIYIVDKSFWVQFAHQDEEFVLGHFSILVAVDAVHDVDDLLLGIVSLGVEFLLEVSGEDWYLVAIDIT